MRKILLLTLIMIVGVAGDAFCQNANRNGFFLEGAVGGIVGNTPRYAYAIENNRMNIYMLKGCMFGIGFGQRFRISNHWAYEVSADVQVPAVAVKSHILPNVYPVGFRYTSPELYRNMSLYVTMRLGGALDTQGSFGEVSISDDGKKHQTSIFDEGLTGGVAMSAGIGINVTTHFYAGFTCDMQYMFSQYKNLTKENCLWGLTGIRLGYRF